MAIGIFGGTFNPPHRGHLEAAQEARRQLGLRKLLIVPAGTPPHKQMPENSPSKKHRLAMAEILFGGQEFTEISKEELERPGKSFAADTVGQIAERHPGETLYLLMGSDMFLNIESWYRYKEILRKATLAVFAREKGAHREIEDHARYILEEYGDHVHIIKNNAIEISSTDLRDLLGHRGGRPVLGDELYAFIIKNRLYGTRCDFKWLRDQAYAMLKPKRIAHVAGCEEEAARLAERWGASVEDAREAAILHDITKKNDLGGQLILCKKYGIITDNVERGSTKLLHAKTGANIARAEFGVSDDVYNAILWHTTGRAGMTLLEKVLYIADYIEPTRDFDGVERLRPLAYEDLRAAVKLGLEISVRRLEEMGVAPHPRSKEAIAHLA